MKIGPNLLHPILSKLLASRHGLRWLLLGFTSLYGVLVSRPELLPGFEILRNSASFKPDGMQAIVRDSVFVRLLIPLTPGPAFLVGQPPKRLICLAPTTGERPKLPPAWASVPDWDFPRPTLDTITCWEAHER